MPPTPNIDTQGTTGEPQGAAAGSGLSDEEWLAKVDSPAQESEPKKADSDDEAFYSRLRQMDPEKLPTDIRQKMEAPFVSHWTKRYQELSQREQRLIDQTLQRLDSSGVRTTPDQKVELLERVKQGDFDAIGQLVERAVEERVTPVAQQVAMRNAIEQAQAMNPAVQTYSRQIVERIQSNPIAAELIQRENFRYAPQVFTAIAAQVELEAMKAQVEKMSADRLQIEREAVERYKRQAKGLPVTTSRAGTTQSGTQAPQEAKSFKEAAEMALKEMGWQS